MCGITGIYHFNKERNVDKSILHNMNETLQHRGPDGEGIYIDKNVGLAHKRLSIIDLATGQQPMLSNDRNYVITYNGEIYNYIELKHELEQLGHQFNTNSDTEVVLESYKEWGIECLHKFNGMWAFALYDALADKLILSRDRLGEKPLFYSIYNNRLVFGSEIKSLLKFGIPKEVALEYTEIYLVLKYIPAPYTFYKYINKLEQGHYLIADKNGVSKTQYWQLPQISERDMLSNKKEIYNNFFNLLEDSVRIRTRSDVPFGSFLSGGRDSTSIVYLMPRLN